MHVIALTCSLSSNCVILLLQKEMCHCFKHVQIRDVNRMVIVYSLGEIRSKYHSNVSDDRLKAHAVSRYGEDNVLHADTSYVL